jgi:hypothetical protein
VKHVVVSIAVAAALVAEILAVLPAGGSVSGSSLASEPPAPSLTPFTNTNITIDPISNVTPIPQTFWGVNIEPGRALTAADAAAIATTPVTYIRYPGGDPADEMNYTTGNITNNAGANSTAVDPPSTFVPWCKAIGCNAILQLPAETDSPATAAYYVSYVDQTLHFTPRYWEIGNEPASWTHFGQPWSTWSNPTKSTISPSQYVSLVQTFVVAIRAVDPYTPIIAPGLGQGNATNNTCWTWCGPVAFTDGPLLSAVSVHSYLASPPPTNRSLASYFSMLGVPYHALPIAIPEDRAVIAQNYSGSLPLFVDEAGVVNSFLGDQSTFGNYTTEIYGGLFEAAEVTQFLKLGVANVDWFDWSSAAGFGWYNPASNTWSPTGQIFHTFMPKLYGNYDNTTLPTGAPATLYAAATTNGTNLSLLVVNVNLTVTSTFPLSTLFSGTVNETTWAAGSSIQVENVPNGTGTATPLSISIWRGSALLEAGNLSATVNPVDVGQATTISTNGPLGGSGSYTFTWSGLPTGCVGAGESFSCIPTSDGGSPYKVVLTVTDSEGAHAAASFLLTVDPTPTYWVKFSEHGLPSGLMWTVAVNGVVKQRKTNGGTDVLNWTGLPSGTYAYSITDIGGWHQSTLTYGGSVVVNGASVNEPKLVYAQEMYTVTFTEKGLPAGKVWSVKFDGVTSSSAGATITFTVANGSYSYKIGSVSGYVPAHSSGSVALKGASLAEVVKFSRKG